MRRRLQVESDKPSSAIGFVKRGRESISPKPRLNVTRALRGTEVVSASTIKSAPRRHAVHSAVAGERLHETHIGVPALKLRVMWNSKASIAPRGIAAELATDPLPTKNPTGDAMARKKNT